MPDPSNKSQHKPSTKVTLESVLSSLQDLIRNELPRDKQPEADSVARDETIADRALPAEEGEAGADEGQEMETGMEGEEETAAYEAGEETAEAMTGFTPTEEVEEVIIESINENEAEEEYAAGPLEDNTAGPEAGTEPDLPVQDEQARSSVPIVEEIEIEPLESEPGDQDIVEVEDVAQGSVEESEAAGEERAPTEIVEEEPVDIETPASLGDVEPAATDQQETVINAGVDEPSVQEEAPGPTESQQEFQFMPSTNTGPRPADAPGDKPETATPLPAEPHGGELLREAMSLEEGLNVIFAPSGNTDAGEEDIRGFEQDKPPSLDMRGVMEELGRLSDMLSLRPGEAGHEETPVALVAGEDNGDAGNDSAPEADVSHWFGAAVAAGATVGTAGEESRQTGGAALEPETGVGEPAPEDASAAIPANMDSEAPPTEQTEDDIPVLDDIAALGKPAAGPEDETLPGTPSVMESGHAGLRAIAVRLIAMMNIDMRRRGQQTLDPSAVDRLQQLLSEALDQKQPNEDNKKQ